MRYIRCLDTSTYAPSVPILRRLSEIDIAKGIGIILVVYSHMNFTHDLQVLIYAFHIPLFFFISGFLFSRERYPSIHSFLVKRISSLFLPYLLFSLAPMLACLMLDRIAGISLLDPGTYRDAFLQIFLARNSASLLNAPMWFVPCLFVVEMLYYPISMLKPILRIPVCLILAFMGWLLESGLIPAAPLPWSADSALFALVFYATGNMLAPLLKQTLVRVGASRFKIPLCAAAVVLCLLAMYPIAMANGKISIGSKILNNGFLLYITGLLGTAAVLSLSVLLSRTGFLRYLGRNTFCIMGIHYLLKVCLLKLTPYTYDEHSLTETLLPFLIVLTLSIAATFVYNAMVSLFYRLRNKCMPS